jgi:sugar phosphate isomerase/epimerase
MWTLSGFIDEIAPDFTDQCRLAADLGLRYAELRSAWEVNILDLDPDQLGAMRKVLASHDIQVSSIGSPIGKIFIDEEFPPHLDRMRHAADVAHYFDAPYVRIFSFFLRPGANPADHRDEVIDRMRALARVAEDADLVLLHENEKDIYGDVPSRCLDIVRSVGSPHLRLAWDPANFVQVGVRPYTDGYAILRPHVSTSRSRTRSPRTAPWCPPARATARWPLPSARCATTASTGSSRWNRT